MEVQINMSTKLHITTLNFLRNLLSLDRVKHSTNTFYVLRPDATIEEVKVNWPDELDQMQALVGGYIEWVGMNDLAEGYSMYAHEEELILNKNPEKNTYATYLTNQAAIFGTVILVPNAVQKRMEQE